MACSTKRSDGGCWYLVQGGGTLNGATDQHWLSAQHPLAALTHSPQRTEISEPATGCGWTGDWRLETDPPLPRSKPRDFP